MTTPFANLLPRLAPHLPALVTLALLAIPSASVSRAQEGTENEAQGPEVRPEVFSEVVEVDVVNVDVYVTDENGDPVTGLAKDDFELHVGGRPVAITNFYAVEGGRPADEVSPNEQTQDQQPAPRIPIHASPIEQQRASIPPDQRLNIVVYIDNFNLSPFKRNRVISELRQFLRTELQPTDEVMLVSYDRSLNLRKPFTFRPNEVSQALHELEDLSAQRLHRNRERVDLLREIEEADTMSEAYQIAANYAGSFRNDTHFTLDALRSIIDGLAGSPGRKAVVYVSEGLPMVPGEDLFQQVQMKFSDEFSMNYSQDYDLSRRYRELTNQANANRVSFYTVDARGLTVLSQASVDYEVAGEAGQRNFIDQVNNSNLQSTIQMLAERTGGRATVNANRFLPDFKRMAEDFRNYYSLGFLGTDTNDGRYYEFEVRLAEKRRGWDVRHRDGYRSKSVETKMHDYTLSALNLDLEDNTMGARLVLGPQSRRQDGLFDVPLLLVIPRDEITFLPVEGKHYARLRLWLAAKDTDDEMSEVRQVPVELSLTEDQFELAGERGVPYRLELQMEEGHSDFAIGIRDELGATVSYFRESLRVGSGAR